MHSVNQWRSGNKHERHDRRLSQSWTYQGPRSNFEIGRGGGGGAPLVTEYWVGGTKTFFLQILYLILKIFTGARAHLLRGPCLRTICVCTLLNLTINFSCVHRGLMLLWKVHQISLKTIFKEPIFISVESKSPVCYSTNISVHVHLSEHTTAPVELPKPCWRYWAWQLLKMNDYILSFIRFLICWTELK